MVGLNSTILFLVLLQAGGAARGQSLTVNDVLAAVSRNVTDLTLAPGNLSAHEFVLAGPPDPKGLVLLRFTTKKDQRKLMWDLDGNNMVARDEGNALVDTASMQVVRMERRLLNLPKSLSRFDVQAYFGPFTIGEQQFWLPKLIRTEIADRDPSKTGTHIAEYSNCKKFGAEIRILP